jgi:sulfatase modifying factor 1
MQGTCHEESQSCGGCAFSVWCSGDYVGIAAAGGSAGSSSMGGAAGTGCTGNFETIQSNTGLCVAKMVPITAPSASQNYSIDVTDVTVGQYDAWLATNPALPAGTDANCGYVTSYAEQGRGYTGADADHHPVASVDWCDAYWYCQGVGKRLCGAIGGGSFDYSAGYGDATQSQWYRACSSDGSFSYPYGNIYQASFCNGADYWNDYSQAEQTVVVGSLMNCVTSATGYAGVYDLSGNVREWEDSCVTGQSARCHVRGGSFWSLVSNDLTCGNGDYFSLRNYTYGDVGFRCCSQ